MLLPKFFPVTCNTLHVGPGSTFVAIKGFRHDGTLFIDEAIKRGATKIIAAHDIDVHQYANIDIKLVQDARKALAASSAQALDYPAKKLKLIGITGTKGKTTTTYLINHILQTAGYKTGLLGGVVNKIGDHQESSALTTPEGDYLHMFFAECVKQGIEYVVMEVSSHALSLSRTYGIEFDAIGFTNLGTEHMDFYNNMDDYFAAKCLLLSQVKTDGAAVINIDDAWGKKAASMIPKQLVALQRGEHGFSVMSNTLHGVTIKINNYVLACPALFGIFNAYNIAMAYNICTKLGVSSEIIQHALQNFPGVPGRLQAHTLKNGAKAFVDFAHNPSSVKAVLEALRPLSNQVIVVFGCGGDRDKTKRPLMGQYAAQLADQVIVTDDNPRTEDRQTIINDIVQGIPHEQQHKVISQPDRRKAIEMAAQLSRQNSIIALLGKGHETYYLINGEKYYFNDYEEIGRF